MSNKQLISMLLLITSNLVVTGCVGNNNSTNNTASSNINQNLQLRSSGLTGSTCDGVGTWNANTAYSTPETLVVSNGKEYKNNWWTQGNNPEQNNGGPGTGQPWTFVANCGVAPTPSPTIEPTITPTVQPTIIPTAEPTITPTIEPTVQPTIPPSKIVTYPTDRGSYVGGTIVYSTNGKMYQCISSQIAPWCNSTAEWAYAPGTGAATTSAWNLVTGPIPTPEPTINPTIEPTVEPTIEPTIIPTQEPTIEPTVNPTIPPSSKKQLSIFWCGFGGDYCGQSTTDDVNPKATMVILAFANSKSDGSLSVDDANWPTQLIKNWQASGKKVLISVGGQNGHWDSIFANPQNFINSVDNIIKKYNIDGVDLDIEGYTTAPQAVSLTINTLRNQIGKNKLIVVSPEVVAVYQAVAIPDPKVGGNAWNYFVPILNASIDQIDYVQPQIYNNWFDTNVMSDKYLMNGYLQWLNKDGLYGTKAFSSSQYVGVPSEKLIMGVLASTSAGGAAFYPTPQMLTSAINTLNSTYNANVGGVMMWDSNWDKLNNYTISNTAVKALGL